MSINLNALIKDAFNTIESIIPDAIVYGRLIKYTSTYNRATAQYDKVETARQSVRCVFDEIEESYRIAENSNTVVSKIHIFGLLDNTVDMFDVLELDIGTSVVTYRTAELTQINIGSSTALHTFIITR